MWQPVHEYVIVFFISGFVYYPQRKKYDKETEKKTVSYYKFCSGGGKGVIQWVY